MRSLPPVVGSVSLAILPSLTGNTRAQVAAGARAAEDVQADYQAALDKAATDFQQRALDLFKKFRDEVRGGLPPVGPGRAIKMLGYAVAGGKTLVAIFRREGENTFGDVFRINLGEFEGDNRQLGRSVWDKVVAWLEGPADPAGDLVILPMWSRDP